MFVKLHDGDIINADHIVRILDNGFEIRCWLSDGCSCVLSLDDLEKIEKVIRIV